MNEPVSVVISHKNSARTLRRCLSCLFDQDYHGQIEVIVVDAGSKDGSIEIAKEFPVRLIVKENCSEPQGQMIGIQETISKIILFTNSDVYVPRDWMKKHVEWHDRGYDLVGGRVRWMGDRYTFLWNAPAYSEPTNSLRSGLGLGFSNCSVGREFLTKIGGLKDLPSQHDLEFALRAIANGAKFILDPSIVVIHDHKFKSLRGSFWRCFGYTRNHAIVMRNFYGRNVIGNGYPIEFPISIFPVSLLEIRWPRLESMVGYWEAKEIGERFGINVSPLWFLVAHSICITLARSLGAAVAVLGRGGIDDLHTNR